MFFVFQSADCDCDCVSLKPHGRSEGFPRTGYFIPGCDGTGAWQISGDTLLTLFTLFTLKTLTLLAREAFKKLPGGRSSVLTEYEPVGSHGTLFMSILI